jgi:hypothetical protein
MRRHMKVHAEPMSAGTAGGTEVEIKDDDAGSETSLSPGQIPMRPRQNSRSSI